MAGHLRSYRSSRGAQSQLLDQHPIYSHKVFIGGLPVRVSLNDLIYSFSRFGTVKEISWPDNPKQVNRENAPRQGYVFVVFEKAKDVNSLLENLTLSGDRLLINIIFDSKESHSAEVKLWKLADGLFKDDMKGFGYPIELFIGGIRSGVTCAQICEALNSRFGEVAYLKLDTCGFRYPVGTGKIRFVNEKGFEKALVLNKLTLSGKSCEIKPFMAREGEKCTCDNPAKEFCIHCKIFICSICYDREHLHHDSRFKELIRNRYMREYHSAKQQMEQPGGSSKI